MCLIKITENIMDNYPNLVWNNNECNVFFKSDTADCLDWLEVHKMEKASESEDGSQRQLKTLVCY